MSRHDLTAFVAYNTTKPVVSGATKTLLGYAYPYGDSDRDDLPDALEYVIGTNPFNTDSDGDGLSDGVEFPLSGIPVSDPCAGGARFCPADQIFANGFNP